MKVMTANLCDALDRPRVTQRVPRGLSGYQIARLLSVLPHTPVGLRDRAIILTLTFTGRRRAEVLGLTAGSLSFEGSTVFYSYRGKGGKTGRRELPQPAFQAIEAWLARVGKSIATMPPTASLWPEVALWARDHQRGTFYANLLR
ncbi:MAG: tyrosine-type recombinase/integrase [Dehalococcoidia bacterium]